MQLRAGFVFAKRLRHVVRVQAIHAVQHKRRKGLRNEKQNEEYGNEPSQY